MIKVKINDQGIDSYVSLQECLNRYYQNPPEGWREFINGWVNEGMEIKNNEEYESFLKKLNLKWFNYSNVNSFYQGLKQSKYYEMFDDDILRYIAHIYGLGYFERINYPINIESPNLDDWLNTKNVMSSYYERSLLSEDEKFSFIDLLQLKNGMNAIRRFLLRSSKW